MIPVQTLSSPRFEAALAFVGSGGSDGRDWQQLAPILAALPGEPDSDAACRPLLARPDRRNGAPGDPAVQTVRAFLPFWHAHQDRYVAAAGRIAERVAAHPRADLGTLFGFDVAIDLQHLGLRRRVGAVRRIAPARLAAIRLYPSAFNPDHLWHLAEMPAGDGPAEAGAYVVHLPIHDVILAAQCGPLLHETAGVPTGIPPHVPRNEPVGIEDTTATLAPKSVALGAAKAPPLAVIFQALGDASRFAMVEMLAQEELTGAEISRRLDLSKPAITHHLNELRRAGLIDERRQGTSIHLTLRRAVFENLSAMSLAHLSGEDPAATPQRSRRKRRAAIV